MNLYAYCGNNPVVYYDPSGFMLCPPNGKKTKASNGKKVEIKNPKDFGLSVKPKWDTQVEDIFKRIGPDVLSKAEREAIKAKELAIKYGYDKSKTVASSGNINTLSGWANKGVDTNIFNRSVTPEDIIKKSKEIGHELTNGGANDHGVLGKSYASHAEKQLSLLTQDPIGVSRKMCSDCKEYFVNLATNVKNDIVVSDPNITRIFTKIGDVVEILKK